MAGLNLLPWRDKERELKKKQFFALLGASVALAGLIVFAGHTYMRNAVSYQESRNQLLTDEIANLDKQIEQIKKLDATKQALLDRMQIIETLQSTRPAIVHLFDEMATALPQGMYLEALRQSDTVVHIEGKAESNARVSTYMDSLDASQWLNSSNLNIISVARQDGRPTPLRDFKLDVQQLLKQDEEKKNESAGG
ncbi:PilN domain-containing protein [uncultured Thiothrix sp.]|jgi:type IV pilus assembly protein PilN|uniref:PilN domain-containing protein n=1 Tax=uncultured Thiothrix sp. TaxID=223185 RepID=UPI0026392F4C|nr:PilN domain-containing protein [uncultured Thiothrix sp.]HMT93065.1 PilN domain-containing protein [Thiolinea sp.]